VSTATKVNVYEDDTCAWHLIEADALAALAHLPSDSVDAILCDPPYGLEIVGEAWDGRDIRRAARRDGLRVSREEAFEHWTRKWAAQCRRIVKPGGHLLAFGAPRTFHRLTCGIEDSGFEIRDTLMWLFAQGFPKSQRLPGGLATTLKPAYEPIVLARKPLDGTTAANLAAWGTGALNIDAARLRAERYWPAHVALAHTPGCTEGGCTEECPVSLIDRSAPKVQPSRLFFCAKAARSEREAGCEQLPARPAELYTGRSRTPRIRRNIHPTVKPLALMRWLVRLTTPPGGIVLDPFAGSGTTGIGAVLEGRRFLGLEREAAYVDIACARLTRWAAIAVREEVLP
jgi:site-specific DNA-methyltransferase (adenine-specific)